MLWPKPYPTTLSTASHLPAAGSSCAVDACTSVGLLFHLVKLHLLSHCSSTVLSELDNFLAVVVLIPLHSPCSLQPSPATQPPRPVPVFKHPLNVCLRVSCYLASYSSLDTYKLTVTQSLCSFTTFFVLCNIARTQTTIPTCSHILPFRPSRSNSVELAQVLFDPGDASSTKDTVLNRFQDHDP